MSACRNKEDVLFEVQDWCEASGTGFAHDTIQRYIEECARREGGTIDWVQVSKKLSQLSSVSLSLSIHIQEFGLNRQFSN